LVFTAGLLHAADGRLTFDVASVKPASPTQPGGRMVIGMTGRRGGPGTGDPGRVHYAAISMRFILSEAFGGKNVRIVAPGWQDDAWFQIDATMPPATTEEQFRVMMQNLLADRFQLKFHRETKDVAAYTLVVAKGGPKMKESVDLPPADNSAPRLQMGADGYAVAPQRAGAFVQNMDDRVRVTYQQTTMQSLANGLAGYAGGPVADATGLAGKYDFILTFAKPSAAPSTDAGAAPDIFSAVQSQLGLRLEQKKGTVEQVVVDHLEKTAAEN
jgi:uncharacterized protein (TIGR03435 family)